MKTKLAISLAVFAPMLLLMPANANNYTITDMNSSVSVNDGSVLDGHAVGAYNWTINGVNQLSEQWFWYSVEGAPQQGIDTLGLTSSSAGTNTLTLNYGSASYFQIAVTYTLKGGSAGQWTSDLGESISITNDSTNASSFSFYQYSNFDLMGAASGDTAWLSGPNTVNQQGKGMMVSETVTPTPGYYELATTYQTLNELNSGGYYTLNDSAGPVTGDTTWAFQWNKVLNKGDKLLINKDISIAHVPDGGSTLILLGVALGALTFLKRRWA